jgi:hypothetical protein
MQKMNVENPVMATGFVYDGEPNHCFLEFNEDTGFHDMDIAQEESGKHTPVSCEEQKEYTDRLSRTCRYLQAEYHST